MRTSPHVIPKLKRILSDLPPRPWSIIYDGNELFLAPNVPVTMAPGHELLKTLSYSIDDVLFDAEAGEKWKALAVDFMALVLVPVAQNELKCNVCGLVNLHMPSCPVGELANECLKLSNAEKLR